MRWEAEQGIEILLLTKKKVSLGSLRKKNEALE